MVHVKVIACFVSSIIIKAKKKQKLQFVNISFHFITQLFLHWPTLTIKTIASKTTTAMMTTKYMCVKKRKSYLSVHFLYHTSNRKCTMQETRMESTVLTNPSEVVITISVRCWCSIILTFIIIIRFSRKFPEELHCKVGGFHFHQPQNCFFAFITESFQGFI